MLRLFTFIVAIISAVNVNALPKHSISIINHTDIDVNYVAVNNKTDLEYKDAEGVITYTLKPGEQAIWPPAHSVKIFDEIDSNTIDMRIWERNLPLLLQTLNSLSLNDGCAVILDNVDRSKIFGQLQYTLTPYCREEIPNDFDDSDDTNESSNTEEQ
ncbi:MAG: hypothetical protein HON55_00330 [Legionellales bacterium]|jgi:hypothetical protein|nr:hypothetical protein [Legionellales bacterium]